jgi:hypothetical protein
MDPETMGIIAPIPTPLPEVSAEQPFTEANWTTLMAVMDTVIPSIRRESASNHELSRYVLPDPKYNTAVAEIKSTVANISDDNLLDIYLDEKPSSIPRFQELLRMTFLKFVHDDGRKKMAFILGALKYVNLET